MGCGSSRVAELDPPAAPNVVVQQQQQPRQLSGSGAAHPSAEPRAAPVRQASGLIAVPRPSRRSTYDRGHGGDRSAGLTEHVTQPLKAPTPWTSTKRTWTKAQLDRERYEFFETRVTGKPEIWNALRQVAELLRAGDVPTAQGIINAAGVTLPTGRLQDGGYDEAGNLYKVPDPLLSDPTNMIIETDIDGETFIGATDGIDSSKEAMINTELVDEKDLGDKGKQVIEKDAVQVRCRLSDRGGPDVIVTLGRSQSVGMLSKYIKAEVEIPSQAKVRIAYLGQMLDDRKSLTDQGWKDGHVLNALVIGAFDSTK